MKDIRDRAFKEFENLMIIANNTSETGSGRIYQVALNFLKLALQADKEIDKIAVRNRKIEETKKEKNE